MMLSPPTIFMLPDGSATSTMKVALTPLLAL